MTRVTVADAGVGRPAGTARLSAAGLTIRVVAVVVVGVLLIFGTVIGSDDDFPLGPFRMFAGVNPNTEDVLSTFAMGVNVDGQTVRVPLDSMGYRRAELEGQLGQFKAHPSQLAFLMADYDRHDSSHPPLKTLRIMQRHYHVVDRHYRGYSDVPVVSWTQP